MLTVQFLYTWTWMAHWHGHTYCILYTLLQLQQESVSGSNFCLTCLCAQLHSAGQIVTSIAMLCVNKKNDWEYQQYISSWELLYVWKRLNLCNCVAKPVAEREKATVATDVPGFFVGFFFYYITLVLSYPALFIWVLVILMTNNVTELCVIL